MIDEPDLLMEYNKDLSRKEAEKIVEKNKETRDEQIGNMFGGQNEANNTNDLEIIEETDEN